MKHTRTRAITICLAAAGAAHAQETFDGPLDPRTAAAVVAALEADPTVAAAGIAEDGTVWSEPARTRTEAELGELFLRQTPAGREALRAWFNGGRPPQLDDDARMLLSFIDGTWSGPGSLESTFGWDGRSVLTFEAGALDWADQVLPNEEPVPVPKGAGSEIAAPDQPVYRYACCDDVAIRENASGAAPVVDHLDRSEAVVVKRLIAPGIGQLQAQLEACLPNDCGELTSLLEGLDLNVYAEVSSVFTPTKKGFVPLVSLFVAPRTADTDLLRLQVGYNRVINALDAMVDGLFYPDDCGQATRTVELGWDDDEDSFWDFDDQAVRACDSALQNPDSDGHDICATCRPIAEAVFGPGGAFDADVMANSNLANDYEDFCALYLAPTEQKQVLSQSAYQCGEYPFGDTHYGYVHQVENKRLVEETFWNRAHRVTMGRVFDQKPISFSQWDMATQSVQPFQTGGLIGARNLWFSLTPVHEPDMPGGKINPQEYEPANDHKLLVQVCGRLPGNIVDGPFVDYHWQDTWHDLINKIDYGRLTFDRLDFCALADLTLSPDLEPALEFTEITQFSLVGADVDGIKITYAAWVYIFGGPILTGIAILGGHIGSIISGLISHMIIALPLYLNVSNNDEWVIEDLMPETLKIKLLDGVLVQLNAATSNALAGLATQTADRFETLCATQIPAVEATHPLHYFYEYLRSECEAIVGKGKWVPFAPHGRSAQQGCYGTTKFFSPAISGQTDDFAFSGFAGQDWYTGLNEDTGCRFELQRYAKVDERLWPTLKCLTATMNLHFNGGEAVPGWNGLGQAISAACGDVGLEALQSLYGDGADLLPLIEVSGGGGTKL